MCKSACNTECVDLIIFKNLFKKTFNRNSEKLSADFLFQPH